MKTDSPEKSRHWHPFLIALYPVTYLYTANWSAVELGDLVVPVVAVLVFALVVFAVFKGILSSADKAALAASWTIACFFSYGIAFAGTDYLYRASLSRASAIPQEYTMLAWGLTWIAGLAFLMWTSWNLAPANRFLNAMSVALLGISGLIVARDWSTEGLAQSNAAPAWHQDTIALKKPDRIRDVYFLVFDRYAGPETLRENYGFDNSAFLDALRERGFQVAEKSCANYPRTILSMASALNCKYLSDESRSDHFYSQMIQDHTVCRSLIDIGYKYAHFGNWYQPLRSNKHASYVLPQSFLPSEFAESLYAITPLSKFLRAQDKYDFVTGQFRGVADVSKDPDPTFTYGHFLVPHPPYVFDRDGSRLKWREARYGSVQENYLRQLEATNRLILETVDEILRTSTEKPIIVLIADEGPYLTTKDRDLDRTDQIRSRARILSAYLLPDSEGAGAVSDSISPVNTFRLIFDWYFGSNLGQLPDRTYFWEEADDLGRPAKGNKRFIDVTTTIAE